ncbi:unnamed protein product [Adineta ricciae]|uniref:Uncharacterized protein n=1 Tax=Adineta ricciae TaxID=249248 RepID=A0A814VA18_ADIRI|nr:unnamed protein product [Adineta ricciae]
MHSDQRLKLEGNRSIDEGENSNMEALNFQREDSFSFERVKYITKWRRNKVCNELPLAKIDQLSLACYSDVSS